MFNLKDLALENRIKKLEGQRFKDFGVVEVPENGIRLLHGMGRVPRFWCIAPVMQRGYTAAHWWFYQDIDSEYLYIKSSVTAKYRITVGG